MIMLLLLSLLCCISAVYGNPYMSVLDIDHDLQSIQAGKNLLYFSLGTSEHILRIAQSIVSAYKLDKWGCFDVHDHTGISNYIIEGEPKDSTRLVIVHGLECLSAVERRALDFAYRLTDSSSETHNVIVLFNMDVFDMLVPKTDHSIVLVNNLKAKLAEALNEDSVFFNGAAFTGRLSNTFFETTDFEIVLPSPLCAAGKSPSDGSAVSLHTVNNMCAQLVQAATHTAVPHRQGPADLVVKPVAFNKQQIAYMLLALLLLIVSIQAFRSSVAVFPNTTDQMMRSRSVSAAIYGGSTHATSFDYSVAKPVDITEMCAESEEITPPRSRNSLTRRTAPRSLDSKLPPETVTNNNNSSGQRSTKDRRSTGSSKTSADTTAQSKDHSPPEEHNHSHAQEHGHAHGHSHHYEPSRPAGEEAIMWAGPDSKVHDTRSKKHTRSSCKF